MFYQICRAWMQPFLLNQWIITHEAFSYFVAYISNAPTSIRVVLIALVLPVYNSFAHAHATESSVIFMSCCSLLFAIRDKKKKKCTLQISRWNYFMSNRNAIGRRSGKIPFQKKCKFLPNSSFGWPNFAMIIGRCANKWLFWNCLGSWPCDCCNRNFFHDMSYHSPNGISQMLSISTAVPFVSIVWCERVIYRRTTTNAHTNHHISCMHTEAIVSGNSDKIVGHFCCEMSNRRKKQIRQEKEKQANDTKINRKRGDDFKLECKIGCVHLT